MMTSPRECETNRGRRRTDVAKTGVERIIDLVKSDADGTASQKSRIATIGDVGLRWDRSATSMISVTGWRVLEQKGSNTAFADNGLGGARSLDEAPEPSAPI